MHNSRRSTSIKNQIRNLRTKESESFISKQSDSQAKSLIKIENQIKKIEPYWKASRSSSKKNDRKTRALNSLNKFKELRKGIPQ